MTTILTTYDPDYSNKFELAEQEFHETYNKFTLAESEEETENLRQELGKYENTVREITKSSFRTLEDCSKYFNNLVLGYAKYLHVDERDISVAFNDSTCKTADDIEELYDNSIDILFELNDERSKIVRDFIRANSSEHLINDLLNEGLAINKDPIPTKEWDWVSIFKNEYARPK